ncbi:MAG: PorT family protein [Spirochaetaceae bacterium]|nr:PorT family protein [Spirochaetaceae bacterium]
MKKVLFIIMCLLISTSSFAIDIKTGLTTGLNLSINSGSDWQDMIDEIGFSNEFRLGFEMGGFWEIPINDIFSVQPEINFLMLRAGFNGSYGYEDYDSYYGFFWVDKNIESGFSTRILEIPILAKLNFGSGKAKFFILAGPVFSIILGNLTESTKEKTSQYNGSWTDESDSSMEPDNRLIFGGAIGFGFSIPASDGRFILELRYRTTFTNIIDNFNMTVNTIGFRIGYSIDIEL